MNYNLQIETVVTQWLEYIKSLPPSRAGRRRGKETKYTPVTLNQKQRQILAFQSWLVTKSITTLDQITTEVFNEYNLYITKINQYGRYYFYLTPKQFLEWCVTKNLWEGDLSKLQNVPENVPSNEKPIPILADDLWMAILKNPTSVKDRAAMAILYNGFRASEVGHLQWDNCPPDYFAQWYGGEMQQVLRKGGYRMVAVLDEYGWNCLRDWWMAEGKPLDGKVFKDKCFYEYLKNLFKNCRDRVLYQPQYRKIRRKITCHSVRHYWAQTILRLNPLMANSIGDVLGGWVPGSQVYRIRYLGIERNFPKTFFDLIKGRAGSNSSIIEKVKPDE